MLFPGSIQATDYYVATSGNNSNSGSESQPWRTIQKAANVLANGDTVFVTAGTYNESVSVTRPGISFITQDKASIQSFYITANNTTVRGFDISNNNAASNGIYVQALNADIENNYIHDVGSGITGEGIRLFAPPSNQSLTANAVVRNNVITRAHEACMFIAGQNHLIEGNDCSHTIQPNVTYGDADCFRFFGSGHTFRSNYCHDIPYDGILVRDSHTDCFQTWADPAVGHDILFENNTCILPYKSGGISAKCWQTEAQAYNLTMRNNVCNAYLASIINSSHDISFYYNTFVGAIGTDAQGIHFNNTLNAIVKDNIFAYLENGVGAIFNEGGSTITGGYNCTYKIGGTRHDPGDVNGLNPLFINEAIQNYHLQQGSPCIDKGVNVGITTDFDGTTRPQGSGFDIGAYEYMDVSVSPTQIPTLTLSPTPVSIPGDANSDGKVDGIDYVIWLNMYLKSTQALHKDGDFNSDGTVDGIDYVIWLNHYGLSSPTPTVTPAPGNYYYINGTTGSDTNSGTNSAPWKTIEHATQALPAGQTVIISDGIYRVSPFTFGPAGLGQTQYTVFKAAPNSRVIITGVDDVAPKIFLENYVRLDGLWLGGKQSENSGIIFGGSPVGRGKQLVNSTIFGYRELSQGSSEYTFYQGNRFIHTGFGRFSHSIYISGGDIVGEMGQHSIVDNNIFISGQGYGVQTWHNPHSSIITRNFVGRHYWGIVIDGSDQIAANNMFWKETGDPGVEPPWGTWINSTSTNIVFINNIMGPDAKLYEHPASGTVKNNAYLSTTPYGDVSIVLTRGQELAQLGVSETEIDNAISNLDSIFSQSVSSIYANQNIEANFSVLKRAIPQGSPLYQTGKTWFDQSLNTNIGPNSASPASEDAFWAAFRSWGLKDWDRFGNHN